ncbi:hypothetical protein DFJ74DRAFT_684074 [Hyaloraphidium curvatum]|nr:hypothetical protein DFJ74DRAFT_684074 [Hyaloraphidium curvatum]
MAAGQHLEWFLWANVAFLAFTAALFRAHYAPPSSRPLFVARAPAALVTELQWQYSLRSNLVIAVVVLAAYVLAIGRAADLLWIWTGLATVNVVTDSAARYEEAPLWHTTVLGHRIALIATLAALAASYWLGT